MIELKLNIAKKKNTILQFEINCKLLPKIGAIPFAIVVAIDIYEIILSNAFFENKSFEISLGITEHEPAPKPAKTCPITSILLESEKPLSKLPILVINRPNTKVFFRPY
jgi:hypothetical protein